MTRAVITGGAGFVGSHLVGSLLDRGYEVVVVDNLLTGDARNLETHLGRKGFEFVQHDVTRPLPITGRLDEVFHLASPASPRDYARYPFETLRVGSVGTENALELARSSNARFLLASTSEVYGDPLSTPQREVDWGNVNPVGPRSVYDEAKRYAEALTMAYHRTHGVHTRIARIFNTYGPRMRPNDGRAIPNFVWQALHGKPLTVYGDGSQTRSFCYVDDLVRGLVALMDRGDAMPVNLGNPEEVTLLDLARLVEKETASGAGIVFEPLPQDDPRQRRPDISRARAVLGWAPQVTLAEGFRRTLPYFRSLVAAAQGGRAA